MDVGSRFPTLISATGRLVAAFTDIPQSETERRFRSLRWQQPPEVEIWKKEVKAVRKRGYSVDRGNYISGVTLVAVPVFDQSDRMTHSLVAAGVGDRLDAARSQALAEDMQGEAVKLTKLLV